MNPDSVTERPDLWWVLSAGNTVATTTSRQKARRTARDFAERNPGKEYIVACVTDDYRMTGATHNDWGLPV